MVISNESVDYMHDSKEKAITSLYSNKRFAQFLHMKTLQVFQVVLLLSRHLIFFIDDITFFISQVLLHINPVVQTISYYSY